MKKLVLVIALAVAASWLLAERPEHGSPPPSRPHSVHDLDGQRRRMEAESKRNLARLKREWAKAKADVPPPVTLERALARRGDRPEPRPSDATAPDTRHAPAWFPASGKEEDAIRDEAAGERVLIGRLSASEDRARSDRDERLVREVHDWLAADVSPTWTPPARELASMMLESYVQPVAQVFRPLPGELEATTSPVAPKAEGTDARPSAPNEAHASVLDDVYTLYRAGGRFDFSSNRKAKLIEIYRRQVVDGRLHKLGGGVILALVGLAALAGYIRADEATKGFYTNRLRLAVAAGLGASGYAVYRVLMHS